MKKKLLSLVLSLAMCLGLLPVNALAVETSPPDWNFLVLFAPMDADYEEDGVTKHVKTSITKEEAQILARQIAEFESLMRESGVMTPHSTALLAPTPLTKLYASGVGPYPSIEHIADYLKADKNINLDAYDHVFVYARMDGVERNYGGVTPLTTFDNGTTYSFIPADYCLRDWGDTPKRPAYVAVHEFLHTMELKLGYTFDLHAIENDLVPGYQSDEKYKACMLDIILNRISSEHGSGVWPSAWRQSIRTLRTMREFTIPEDVATVGRYQFKSYKNLGRITIPSTVTSIKDHAFQFCSSLSDVTLPTGISSIEEGTFEQCTALTEITIPSGVTSIGTWAFESCSALAKIYIPASVTSIEAVAFQRTGLKDVYYGGTAEQWKAIKIGEYNTPLTQAKIHYNSAIETPATSIPSTPTTPTQPVKFTDVPVSAYYYAPVQWAVQNGITAGTSVTTFSPDQICTHGQILTFLWRAKGSPKPTGAVSGTQYYAAALQWAKEQGIVSGGRFSVFPDSPCTRSAAVTYLWKSAGIPAAKAVSFTDVPDNASYAKAVAWAVEQGVTAGTSATTFSPDNVCTRGQIVTILYRAFVEP